MVGNHYSSEDTMNWSKLHEDRKAKEAELKAFKKTMRRNKSDLKSELTARYILIAHSRGHTHTTSPRYPPEEIIELIQTWTEHYTKVVEPIHPCGATGSAPGVYTQEVASSNLVAGSNAVQVKS